MEQTIYIKAPQCIEITSPEVVLGDFLTVYAADKSLQKQVEQIPFYSFSQDKPKQIVISVLKIIETIHTLLPDVTVENLGEGDFILSYQPEDKRSKFKEGIYTVFICLVAFFGGGYAIMAYNTDVGAKELFTYLSTLFTGNPKSGVLYLSIAYAIGLTGGMLLFFNHFGSKKITPDPTPLEVQMRLYEKDVSTTIIKDVSRRGQNIDVTKQL